MHVFSTHNLVRRWCAWHKNWRKDAKLTSQWVFTATGCPIHIYIMLYWHLVCSNILLTHLMMLALLTCPAWRVLKEARTLNKSRIHYANRHHQCRKRRDLMFILYFLLYNKPLHKSSLRKFSFSNSPIGTTLLVSLTRSSITKFKSGVLFCTRANYVLLGTFYNYYDGFFFIGYIEVMPKCHRRGSVATKALALG